MISCGELLIAVLNQWAEAYGKKLKPSVISWWLQLFEKEKPAILAKAIERVSLTAERMPTPGHLTRALNELKESMPCPPSTMHNYRKIVAKDPETLQDVDAIAYDYEPGIVCFRATDCAEGRAFLNELSRLAGVDQPFPKMQDARALREAIGQQKADWVNRATGVLVGAVPKPSMGDWRTADSDAARYMPDAPESYRLSGPSDRVEADTRGNDELPR